MEYAVLLGIGIALLLGGGTLLVQGASTIARGFGVSPMIVGLTVVAFGTSSPELVISIAGALDGQSDIAFGNVVGSNIANLGLVLGAAALIAPFSLHGQLIQRELPLLLLATCVLVILALDGSLRGSPPMLDRSDGLVLICLFTIFVYVSIRDVLRQRKDPLLLGAGMVPIANSRSVRRTDWLMVAAGMLGLAIGGHLTISNGVSLAAALGISKTAVGLVIIAVGTSLPELITSMIAAIRNESDISVGNVVGSNIFNGLLVLPTGAIITPMSVPAGGVADLMVSLLFAAALIPIFLIGSARMGRRSGAAFLVIYLLYMSYRALSGN
jgi:cation:H+ antiporter